MKTYTDLEQSKKLFGILPPETADMEYMFLKDGSKVSNVPFVKENNEQHNDAYNFIPCWSLVALIDVLPVIIGNPFSKEALRLRIDKGEYNVSIWYDNLCTGLVEETLDIETCDFIDACVNMIIKLNKLNLL